MAYIDTATKRLLEKLGLDSPQPGSWLWPTKSKRISHDVHGTHQAIDIQRR